MRRLTRIRDDERGAAAVVTAILMVVLLGFGAIAVDVGMMYAERGQLQNGADSAALAVANNCAKGACGNYAADARSMANSNSNDGASKVESVTFPTAGSVKVNTSSRDGAGHDSIQLAFANIFGISTANVGATATASYGGPSAGPAAFPITFSDCQFDLSGTIQLLQYHMTDPAHTCQRGTSGLIVPGGFGWLVQDSGLCQATININANGGIADSRPGNSPPGNCDSVLNGWVAKINAGNPAIVLLPVYDQATGNGANATFHIRGFAAYQVLGWKFSGGNNSPPLSFHNTGLTPSSLNCTGGCRGIIGKFVQYVSMDAGFTPGGPDLGGRFVALTK
ncbi:TadE/TadG family type IV pilus assembly protein (plasmid) [Pseudarthrobacter sp. P1]|uniref:TadE/TadG family type IV pilus assembly protein n=1 Tax=Pseudarthrobacter sp. P1 TaxID=3418418 RepID=UPI003CE834F0